MSDFVAKIRDNIVNVLPLDKGFSQMLRGKEETYSNQTHAVRTQCPPSKNWDELLRSLGGDFGVRSEMENSVRKRHTVIVVRL